MQTDLHFPEDLRYALSHVWVRTEGDEAVLGITDDAQFAWGEAGFVSLPVADTELASGEPMGQVSCALAGPCDLCTPLSGTVIAANEALADDPALLNTDPYGDGWLLRLDMADPAELRDLLDAGAYRRALTEPGPENLDAALSGIFSHSVDPMLVIDRYRRIVAVNPAAEALTGRPAAGIVGAAHCYHLFRCETGGEALHGIDCIGVQAHENGGGCGRFRIQRADGTQTPVLASYSPLPTDGGKLTLITLHPQEAANR